MSISCPWRPPPGPDEKRDRVGERRSLRTLVFLRNFEILRPESLGGKGPVHRVLSREANFHLRRRVETGSRILGTPHTGHSREFVESQKQDGAIEAIAAVAPYIDPLPAHIGLPQDFPGHGSILFEHRFPIHSVGLECPSPDQPGAELSSRGRACKHRQDDCHPREKPGPSARHYGVGWSFRKSAMLASSTAPSFWFVFWMIMYCETAPPRLLSMRKASP